MKQKCAREDCEPFNINIYEEVDNLRERQRLLIWQNEQIENIRYKNE